MAMKKSEIKENPFATATTPSIVTPPKQETETVTVEAPSLANPEKVRMSIYVRKSAKDIIEATAKAKNTSVSHILAEILDDYAKKNEAYAKGYFALQEKIQEMTNEFNSKMVQ